MSHPPPSALGGPGPPNGAAHVPDVLDSVLPAPVDLATAGDAADPTLAALYPRLFALLTRTLRSDGSRRQVSSLTIFSECGVWKACLHERDADMSLWATADTLDGLWPVLEARLGSARGEWRASRYRTGQRR